MVRSSIISLSTLTYQPLKCCTIGICTNLKLAVNWACELATSLGSKLTYYPSLLSNKMHFCLRLREMYAKLCRALCKTKFLNATPTQPKWNNWDQAGMWLCLGFQMFAEFRHCVQNLNYELNRSVCRLLFQLQHKILLFIVTCIVTRLRMAYKVDINSLIKIVDHSNIQRRNACRPTVCWDKRCFYLFSYHNKVRNRR